ncbi:MAG: hypothetical protein ACFCVG_15585 [Kineosporiaceae bacterium]
MTGAPPDRVTGAGRALVALYAVFAVAATSRATYQLITKAGEAPVAYALSAFAAAVYVVAALALARPGRRARGVAAAAVGTELVGVLVVGTLSLVLPGWFPDDTVWSRYGLGYGLVPLVLPLLGTWWLATRRAGAERG